MTEDFYDLLEIPSDASQDEIKEAYREQVRVYHPDLNDDDRAQAQFTAVKKAYDILGDPVERQAYDRLGHEDYVAKRTSGLPSPDVWQSETDSSGTSSIDAAEATATTGSTTGSTGSNRSRSRTASGASASTATGSTTGSSGTSTAGSTGDASTSGATGEATGSATATNGGTATGGRGVGSTRGTAGETGSNAGRFADNALVQWWHRQNFAWPLIWLSVLTYVVGLGHYGRENADSLRLLWADLTAIGADPAALWDAVTTQRYGVQPPVEFVTGVELVAPPLPPTQWYGVLAGVVVAAVAIVGLYRAVRRRDTWGPVTIDETIVVAVAIGASTTLLGGPLLAGAALMPVLFGVIVYRTRQLPGWSPSYGYVLAVLAPAIGFALGTAGIQSLPAEFAAFVLVPLIGALGLPLRATIRKRFGR
ncbi:J domain-containing protein [Halosolutus amylolyticus]|uniref:J domain-containing protein n=1 Tax=Halosolutus amylolyticus TaxID=2932267 RepID=A0ABD5PNL2_9EURY|nr:DnaJ domain-containing protein [Halosolutus amylolyticus]